MYKPTIELLDKTTHDLTHVRFKDGPFAGISFTLGEVSFQEDEDADSATMSYNYDIIENPYDTYDKETFEKYVGDFLIQTIEEQLKTNDLIFTGGVDSENRTDDNIQSDNK